MNEREIFLAALEIEDPQARDSFLDSICKHGDPVRRRVNKLLKAHYRPQDALDRVADFIVEQAAETSGQESVGTDNDSQLHLISHALLRMALGEPFDLGDNDRLTVNSSTTIPSGKRLDRYQIKERIGFGGMGEVYLAHDTKLERKVAVKLLAPARTRDPKWLQQFRREARAAGALNHPNILTIYEIGESGGVHYLATEFVDGMTLRQKITQQRPTVMEAIDYAIQMASALAAAHAANIIHRDLKPENLILRADGLLKVLDFGLAKQLEAPDETKGKTRSLNYSTNYVSDPGIVIGTVRYMSPEQARGQKLDTRTDIFGLGIVFYELLVGKSPFQGETTSDVLVAVLEHEPVSIRQLAPQVPPNVEQIVFKCLSKNRDGRYASANELLIDLKRVALTIQSNPPDQAVENAAREHVQIRGGLNWDSDEIPSVRYASSGDVNIAYQVLGEGPIDLVFVMGWVSHLEMFWTEPLFAKFLKRLATFSRLILFDKRGTGLSDKVPLDQLPTLEQRMDDVRAVMDAVGSKKAVLCGISEGGPMCTLFAATYPEKTTALTMIGCYARRLWAPDYPWGPTDEHRQHFLDEMRRDWGGPVGIDDRCPSMAADPQFRNWWATYLRMGASPGAALALTQMNAQIDIRPILPTVQVPTLVIHRTHDRCLLVEEGRFLAEQIPGAKFVELPGNDHLPFVGDQDAVLEEIEEFLTGVRQSPKVNRVLATVLFVMFETRSDVPRKHTDDSTTNKLFQSHVVREAELFKGRHVSFRENAFLVTFDGPARAVRAGIAINETAKRLAVKLQTGVHTGECDLVDQWVTGTAVDLAQLTATHSPQSEILVSSTVKDLVVGSGLSFDLQTTVDLPGNLGQLSLYRVART